MLSLSPKTVAFPRVAFVALCLSLCIACGDDPKSSDAGSGGSAAAGAGGDGGSAGTSGSGGVAGSGGDAAVEYDAAVDAQIPDAGVDAAVDAQTADAGSDAAVPDTWPKTCADIYDQNLVPDFDLTFTTEAWQDVWDDCIATRQTYRPVQFTYDGQTVDAMVRLKGNWTWRCDKMQFVVSFNETNSQGRFHGLRKLVFDAPWYDHTLLHERLAFPIFEQRGLPYSCANNARVSINGEYYGLYANLERLDKEYLQRNFEEADGNLYQAGDELKTNEDINDQSDIEALRAATTVAEIDALMDLDQAVAEWATEAMLPALDNYWAGVQINYYLYNHPSRGFLYLPYDLDITFGDSAYANGDLIWPDAVEADPIVYEHVQWLKEDLFKIVLADEAWCRRFVDELVLARAAYSPEDLSAQVDLWNAQILQSVTDDPNKTFSNDAHDTAITSLKMFFVDRASFVDQWLEAGATCPAY